MYRIFQHPNGIFRLLIPEDWRYEIRESSVIFCSTGGEKGALVVSCVAPPPGNSPDPVGFIDDFVAKKLPPEQDERPEIVDLPMHHPGTRLIYTSYRAKGDVWRIWVLSANDRLLFVTYNCDPSLEGQEDADVDDIVGSADLR